MDQNRIVNRDEVDKVACWTVGALKLKAKAGTLTEVARVDGVDMSAHVWTNGDSYLTAVLTPNDPPAQVTDVAYFGISATDEWGDALLRAVNLATRMVIACTKAALG